MEIGMVGLGKMGANMTRRLLRGGHDVTVYDIDADLVEKAAGEGATATSSTSELAGKLTAPRAVWVMVPAGEITQKTIDGLAESLEPGDVIVDGGNSRYLETIERGRALAARGIDLVDCGTSGGIWGLEEGYCLMIGGSEDAFARLEPIFKTLAPENGYARVGAAGSGHYVKMVHNGIEYALMQAYAEGFAILEGSRFDLDLAQVAEVWRYGSVVRSWLLDLTASALAKDPGLETVSGYVEDSGEGRWTVESAIESGVPAPAIALALFTRFASRERDPVANRIVAALRREFGGHAVLPAGGD